jgi:hypothetical protein
MAALFLLWLLAAHPVSAESIPASYAIDGNGTLIDLTGYSRYSNGDRPTRIILRNAENFFERTKPLHNQLEQPETWRNPVQWQRGINIFPSPKHRNIEAEDLRACPTPPH